LPEKTDYFFLLSSNISVIVFLKCFGNPKDEYQCEETGEDIVLMKDRIGRVFGFDKLNFGIPKPDQLQMAFETVAP
jgi:hypothetical protein